ncbi:MAG: transposase [Deltaproteobacteria bacterium]|nr:transposase [Deltaproteobacteria bacterium]
MARKPRIHYPGAVYHVILRGNAGGPIFFEDGDRFRFYLFLQQSVERFGYRIHGFCCMTTHIHLVIQVTEIPLALIMQNLSLRYTKWVNYTQGRAGHVFQGRYKALLLDADAYLLELVRYVHLNPVRAVMVKLPEDYPWSGHRAYLGRETLPWLTTDWVLSLLGRRIDSARKAYRQFVADGMDEGKRDEFHSGTCEGRILGDDDFADDALCKANQIRRREWTLTEVVASVCRRYGITEEQLRSPGKARTFSEARALAAVIVQESPHLFLTELGKLFNRDVSTIGKAAQRMIYRSQTDDPLATNIEAVRRDLG